MARPSLQLWAKPLDDFQQTQSQWAQLKKPTACRNACPHGDKDRQTHVRRARWLLPKTQKPCKTAHKTSEGVSPSCKCKKIHNPKRLGDKKVSNMRWQDGEDMATETARRQNHACAGKTKKNQNKNKKETNNPEQKQAAKTKTWINSWYRKRRKSPATSERRRRMTVKKKKGVGAVNLYSYQKINTTKPLLTTCPH